MQQTDFFQVRYGLICVVSSYEKIYLSGFIDYFSAAGFYRRFSAGAADGSFSAGIAALWRKNSVTEKIPAKVSDELYYAYLNGYITLDEIRSCAKNVIKVCLKWMK